MQTFEKNGHKVEFSHLDKFYFPQEDLTKGDLLDYFKKVAPLMLPYLEDRPLMMERYPDGVEGERFYQKQIPDYFPDWVERAEVDKKGDGEKQQLVLCNNVETLLYLVNQGCLTFHPWLSRKDRLNEPDRAVIDLDPADDDDSRVRQAARIVVEFLQGQDLKVFLTTTGSSGYHIVIPLRRSLSFDQVRERLLVLTKKMEEENPRLLTTEQRKPKRKGRIYLDIARNAYAQTSVSIYSVRGRPSAPVATPLDLDELDRSSLSPRKYKVKNIFRRLAQKEDPWKELWSGGFHQRL